MNGVSIVVEGKRIPCADYKYPDMRNSYYERYKGSVKFTKLVCIQPQERIDTYNREFSEKLTRQQVCDSIRTSSSQVGCKDDVNMICSSWGLSRANGGKVGRAQKSNEKSDKLTDAVAADLDILLQRAIQRERQLPD